MSEQTTPTPEPITDSPWFWLYMFATFALIMLVVFRPKLDVRQADIEQQHQGRQMAIDSQAGEQTPTALSTPGNTLVNWNYFYVVFGILVAIGWGRLWYVRFRTQRQPPENSSQ